MSRFASHMRSDKVHARVIRVTVHPRTRVARKSGPVVGQAPAET